MIVADDGDRAAVHRDGIDGVEELALRRVLVRQEMDVVDRKEIQPAKGSTKIVEIAAPDRLDVFVGELFAGQVPDLGSSVTLLSSCTDSAEEMGIDHEDLEDEVSIIPLAQLGQSSKSYRREFKNRSKYSQLKQATTATQLWPPA